MNKYKKEAEEYNKRLQQEQYRLENPGSDLPPPSDDDKSNDWEGRPSSEDPFAPPPPKLTEPAAFTDLSAGSNADDSTVDAKVKNLRKTNVRTFLQQRSVQTLMFLCDNCRDPHTVVWLEDFGGHR